MLARKINAGLSSHSSANVRADILWLCVTDDAIGETARALSKRWKGTIALHSSGALTSETLAPLRREGVALGSLHPMMTFVGTGTPSLKGIACAVEGDAAAVRVARRIAHDLGASAFEIERSRKPLYHAMGSFSSPLLIALLAMAERIGQAAGLPARSIPATLQPILRQTLENYFRSGAANAFSGPLVRGDIETVRGHLRELKKVPDARDIYLSLARSSINTLPVHDRAGLKKVLGKTKGSPKRAS